MGTKKNDKPADAKAKLAKAENDSKPQPLWFNQPNPIDRFTGWLVVWTSMLFLATTGLGIVALLQWNELHKTDETLRKTLLVTQRAWIVIDGIDSYGELKLGNPLPIGVLYSNAGQSPARGMMSAHYPIEVPITSSVDEITIQSENVVCEGLTISDRGVVVFPKNVPSGYTFYVPGKFITNDVVSGKTALVIQGCFVYETMEEIHYSQYCIVAASGGKAATKESVRLCASGQWAD
jgi:hypothetical protein